MRSRVVEMEIVIGAGRSSPDSPRAYLLSDKNGLSSRISFLFKAYFIQSLLNSC